MRVLVTITLNEVLEKCNDWETFCQEQGWSEWAVNEGGGNIVATLTLEEAKKYGLIKED